MGIPQWFLLRGIFACAILLRESRQVQGAGLASLRDTVTVSSKEVQPKVVSSEPPPLSANNTVTFSSSEFNPNVHHPFVRSSTPELPKSLVAMTPSPVPRSFTSLATDQIQTTSTSCCDQPSKETSLSRNKLYSPFQHSSPSSPVTSTWRVSMASSVSVHVGNLELFSRKPFTSTFPNGLSPTASLPTTSAPGSGRHRILADSSPKALPLAKTFGEEASAWTFITSSTAAVTAEKRTHHLSVPLANISLPVGESSLQFPSLRKQSSTAKIWTPNNMTLHLRPFSQDSVFYPTLSSKALSNSASIREASQGPVSESHETNVTPTAELSPSVEQLPLLSLHELSSDKLHATSITQTSISVISSTTPEFLVPKSSWREASTQVFEISAAHSTSGETKTEKRLMSSSIKREAEPIVASGVSPYLSSKTTLTSQSSPTVSDILSLGNLSSTFSVDIQSVISTGSIQSSELFLSHYPFTLTANAGGSSSKLGSLQRKTSVVSQTISLLRGPLPSKRPPTDLTPLSHSAQGLSTPTSVSLMSSKYRLTTWVPSTDSVRSVSTSLNAVLSSSKHTNATQKLPFVSAPDQSSFLHSVESESLTSSTYVSCYSPKFSHLTLSGMDRTESYLQELSTTSEATFSKKSSFLQPRMKSISTSLSSSNRGFIPHSSTTVTSSSRLTNAWLPKSLSGALMPNKSSVKELASTSSVWTSIAPDGPTNMPLPAEIKEFQASFAITNRKFTKQLADPLSEPFKELASDLEEILNQIFYSISGFLYVKIQSFSKGSVMCNFVISCVSESDQTPEIFKQTLIVAINEGRTRDFKITKVEVKDLTKAVKGKKEDKATPLKLISVSAFAGVVALVIVVLIIMTLKKRTRSEGHIETNDVYPLNELEESVAVIKAERKHSSEERQIGGEGETEDYDGRAFVYKDDQRDSRYALLGRDPQIV